MMCVCPPPKHAKAVRSSVRSKGTGGVMAAAEGAAGADGRCGVWDWAVSL